MGESSLSLGWADFKKAVGFFLNYGESGWTNAQQAEIEDLVHTGYRRVLYPSHIPDYAGYEWSFLRPTTTLQLTAGTGDYALPDNFGRIIGGFNFAADKHFAPVQIISERELLDMRSASNYSKQPMFAAIRFKTPTGATGQRQEVLFYPKPDAGYVLGYSYDAYQSKMSDSIPYPLGGMEMSEVIKESCLAAAEIRNGDEYGIHNQTLERLLINAIERDKKKRAQVFGNMGRPDEEDSSDVFRRGRLLYGGAYSITYKGSQVI